MTRKKKMKKNEIQAENSEMGKGVECRDEGSKALYIDHFPTTRRFYELQSRLGFDQPSKVLGWLMDAAAPAIAVHHPFPNHDSKKLDLNLSLRPLSININETIEESFLSDQSEVTQLEKLMSLLPSSQLGSSANDYVNVDETLASSLIEFFPYKRDPQNTNQFKHSSVGIDACESYASKSPWVFDKECNNCLRYCGIFPKDYEIDKDTLIQLWISAGFIAEEPMEDVGAEYLKVLQHQEVISVPRLDPLSGKEWHMINHLSSPEEISGLNHVRVDAENLNPLSATLEGPCHVTVQHSSIDFEMLRNLTEMKTLMFLHRHESCFDRVPDNFFISLKHLVTLDLSGTRLLELSSLISHAKCLRYLDLSHTLIKQLPETIYLLHYLQTLKLCKCPRLISLPKGITRLYRLRHLEFDTPCSTCFMPPGMGKLTSLQTLLEFPVAVDYGCTVQELNHMNDLRGSLCLSRLENVERSNEAKVANLCSKKCLKKLEFRWSPKKRRNTKSDGDILTYLRPHKNLQDLRILCYGGCAFPTWISDPSFKSLVNITLFKCENCLSLPSLGMLPSLESLSLYEFTALKVIDFHFNQDIAVADAHHLAFPKLQKLEIISMLNVEAMRDPENCDFPCLVEMTIKDCPNLVTLWSLSGISSLNYLEINNCQMLSSLPGKDLSVETLVIEGCPLLCPTYTKESPDWHEIAHVPKVFIDQVEMPSSN